MRDWFGNGEGGFTFLPATGEGSFGVLEVVLATLM
jgi:hypothetical protein